MITNSGDPDFLEQALYSEHLLTPTEREKARQETLTNKEKMEYILTGLERHVCAEPDDFYTVLGILKSEPAMQKVGERLRGSSYSNQYTPVAI